ncbi:MAG: SCO family protein [Chitinophagaceae bacterium]|nr:SCO family protein [Chitinophagaceae bacterium]MBK8953766.1 SCO family protein [Chitinophagaceae bacterium]
MSKKGIFYLAFFTVLIIGFYFGLREFIPGFNKKRFPPISYIRPFSFINQDGQAVTEKDVAGKVYVASFFFTTCTSICPPMNNNLKKVYEKYKDEKDFLLLSHTCMPEIDSAEILRKFADKMNVDTKKWIFLTGRKDSLYNMARVSYTIDDPQKVLTKIEDDFIHTQHWALVDRNGDVRKIYDGLKNAEVEQLIKDIPKYLEEK